MNRIHEALAHMAGPLEAQDGAWSQTYVLQPDFPGFSGHFPGHPLVPGVVQVSMALRVIAQACGRTPVLREIIQSKFKAPVEPMQSVRVSVQPASGLQGTATLPEKWICTLTRSTPDGSAGEVAQCRLLLEFPREPQTAH